MTESELFDLAYEQGALVTTDLPKGKKWAYNRDWMANQLRQARLKAGRACALAMLDCIKHLVVPK